MICDHIIAEKWLLKNVLFFEGFYSLFVIIWVMRRIFYEIGIDEAGRGPLAGPVAVGAVAFKTKHKSRSGSYVITNNGEITYSYKEAEMKGISKDQFRNSIDELQEKSPLLCL